MSKTNKLAVKDIEKNLTAIQDNDALPPALMRQLEEKVPEWLKEYEADGTAVLRWNFEHLIIIEHLLQHEFNFTEEELTKLEKKLKEILPLIGKMKMETPRLLTKQDYQIATAMIARNKQLYTAEKAGIALPDTSRKHIK